MNFSSGDRLGPYEILAPIGAGGMGEVYRARDTKLKRDVALKVLPEAFARDPERLARFEREAEVLASLNHPNIASIYGVVEDRALVMELVEGVEPKGPLPFDEAWHIASHIAAALEYAHDHGVIHRDLKPANIKITPDGVVKLLDFGLAKAFTNQTEPQTNAENSPTLTIGATEVGVILGTAAYMAPEQAKGKSVDKRIDIWAFGVILYELLTGERLFKGEDVSDTLVSVLRDQPDLSKVSSMAHKLLRRCLEKDPKKRLRDIGDAAGLLDEAPVSMPVARGAGVWKIAAVVLAALIGITLYMLRPKPAELKPLVRLDLELEPPVSSNDSSGNVILSPDGTRIVYVGQGRLFTRRFDQSETVEIKGTEGATSPFFSPDGQSVGFYADRALKKASIEGGGAITLSNESFSFTFGGGTWGEDGNIITAIGGTNSGLARISATGGKLVQVTEMNHQQQEIMQTWPQILVGGKLLLFTGGTLVGQADDAYAVAMSLGDGRRKIVQRNTAFTRYAALSQRSGYLLYLTGGTLFAVPCNPETLEPRGDPAPVLQDVQYSQVLTGADLDISRNGTLIYRHGSTGGANFTVQWLDSTGKLQPLLMKPGAYLRPKFSPDGNRLVIQNGSDLWIYDWQRDVTTRITYKGGSGPLWSPDGGFVLYQSSSGASWVRSDGGAPAQLLVPSQGFLFPWSFSSDGRHLAYFESSGSGSDIFIVPIENDGTSLHAGKPEAFLKTPADERHPSFSPDGRWLAYTSNESGAFQIYVRSFPDKGGRSQVSSAGGTYPEWSRTGHELFFRNLDNHVMVAGYSVKGDVFATERPRVWSQTRLADTSMSRNWDLHPDGKRIAALISGQAAGDAASATHVTILFNFFDELRRKVPLDK